MTPSAASVPLGAHAMNVEPVSPQSFAEAHAAALSLLSDEIAAVRQGVENAASDLPGPGGAAARLMVDRPGKMVRPLLVGLVHRALGGRGGQVCSDAAALVEVIHLSTLLHDDVVDEAAMRRGAPSAAFAVGNAAAVLGGDALVVRAITKAHTLGPSALERTLFALHRLVIGELVQLQGRGDVGMTGSRAREIASLKTGSLMRLCAELGALTAGSSLERAVEVGAAFERLGIAFQVVDDLLDLIGDPVTVGKAVGKDVAQGTISFPLALALERAPMHRKAIAKAFGLRAGESRLGALVHHALKRTGALPDALAAVETELSAVSAFIASLHPSVARDTLAQVCGAMGRRGS
jgi:octaprenyl-diphosphate synthase